MKKLILREALRLPESHSTRQGVEISEPLLPAIRGNPSGSWLGKNDRRVLTSAKRVLRKQDAL